MCVAVRCVVLFLFSLFFANVFFLVWRSPTRTATRLRFPPTHPCFPPGGFSVEPFSLLGDFRLFVFPAARDRNTVGYLVGGFCVPMRVDVLRVVFGSLPTASRTTCHHHRVRGSCVADVPTMEMRLLYCVSYAWR